MAAASKFSIQCQTKSISLPCRSHPTTLRIEELLNRIKTTSASSSSSRPSAEIITSGLSQLTELYKCMDDLLNSSTIRVLMARQQNEKWVDDLIDESVKFLDICGSIWDMLSQIKEQIRDLQCALRRRNGELSSENGIAKYVCFRKKMKKDVKGLVASLKQVENMTSGVSVVVDSDSHQLAAVMKAVLGVGEMTISVFESLLMFFSMPAVSKTNRWSFVVSKLIHKGMVACEGQQKQGTVNELERIDAALQSLCKYRSSSEGGNVQTAQSRLELLGAQIDSMDSGLECMFRCLVRTRASLLNIISQ
ncbi:protein BPS1, chloroplastic-like [Cynara cardunculus var. scolymus]|uniref:protein BPS1, chloroplastic-like n=1 Tax=Cynara cardunculus var. scolymus TaxID=59895 RepID=UPI000D6245BD|nr:protein BPS1, chloroplastic-like [Cynara cardunculus var. scolymus]